MALMYRTGLRAPCYTAAGWIAIASGVVGAFVGASLKADPKDWPSIATPLLAVQGSTYWLVPLCALTTGGLTAFRRVIGPPWVWGAIHEFVDSFRNHIFKHQEDDALHHHRVTLFQFCPWWRWPCFFVKVDLNAKLIPIERSGHMTKKSKCYFLAPDDGDSVFGVAGAAFTRQKTIVISGLPEITTDSTKEEISLYAKLGYVTEDWVRERIDRMRKNPNAGFARSYCGIPIKVKGKVWGTIVIDSRHPTAIDDADEGVYELLGRSLSKLLERV